MERDHRVSGPPLPPGPGGVLPLLLSFGLVVFLLAGFLTMGTIVESLRPGGLDAPTVEAEVIRLVRDHLRQPQPAAS